MLSKIKSTTQIKLLAQRLRRKSKKIVFTNGCFDILHAGHVTYLAKAKKLGHYLIVGLNSDRSVREIKGPKRPINPERTRALILSALYMVDYVVIFNDPTPLKLIQIVKPHILVKGSDWARKNIAGANEVVGWGGKVHFISLLKGYSTTNTLSKIKNR